MTRPWAPLFTLSRSGLPEVTVDGIVSVTDGTSHPLMSTGDTQALLWSRSLLKPWQLLSQFETLSQAYPKLTDEQWAVMMASHNGEARHLAVLQSLLELEALSEQMLQCPACYPMNGKRQWQLEQQGTAPSRLFHPCSGKHLGWLLSLKAQEFSLTEYLNPEHPSYTALRGLLKELTGERGIDRPETVDGCGMPNMALSAEAMAKLFHQWATLANVPEPWTNGLIKLRQAVKTHPEILGGTGRLDTRLIQGELTSDPGLGVVAKEGADGLLGIGIEASDRYPRGLGILIKLASGYEPRYLDMVSQYLLEQLGLKTPAEKPQGVVTTEWHLSMLQTVQG